jgi:predicted DNA-binding ribbon-helix-helix protein
MKTRERRNSERSAPSRNIWIGSHRTSVRLEPAMWAALNDIAVERGKTVHDAVLEINRGRKGISLTAAIRVYIVAQSLPFRTTWRARARVRTDGELSLA